MPQPSRHSEDTPPDRARRAAKKPQPSDAMLAAEAAIDEAIEMTFPASDPPAWTSPRVGRTGHEPDAGA